MMWDWIRKLMGEKLVERLGEMCESLLEVYWVNGCDKRLGEMLDVNML